MLSITIATPADAADLAPLARDTFSQSFRHYPPDHLAAFLAKFTPAFFEALIADPTQRVWVARREGRAIGYAHAGPCELPHASVTPGCGELKRIYVHEDAQGAGVGSALLQTALAWLTAPGGTLWIGVFSENIAAQRLYARHGFHKVGEYDFIVGATHDREFILRREAS